MKPEQLHALTCVLCRAIPAGEPCPHCVGGIYATDTRGRPVPCHACDSGKVARTGERERLEYAVLAAPEDDTPRLVMADWLDEQGENDRAEFVRVQCELACYPTGAADPRPSRTIRMMELLRRERQLWESFGKPYDRSRAFGTPPGLNWLAQIVPARHELPSDGEALVSRGFACSLSVPPDRLRAGEFGAVFAAAPVTGVTVLGMEPDESPDERAETTAYRWLAFARDYPQRSADPRRIPEWAARHTPGFLYHTAHPTREAAMAEAGVVWANWGRSLVGLPPLPLPAPVPA